MGWTRTEWLLLLLLPFGVTLIIGAGNYLLVRLAYDRVDDFVEASGLPCALLLFLFVLPAILFFSFVFPPLLLVLLLSVLAAMADKEVSDEGDTLGWHYWRICVAVIISLVDGLLLWLIQSRFVPIGLAEPGIGLSCFAGFMVGPMLAPPWIWAYRSLNSFFDQRSAKSRQFD